MEKQEFMYPILEVHMDKLTDNVKNVYTLCNNSGVQLTGIIKGCNAMHEVSTLFEDHSYHSLGSSRMSQLKTIKESGLQSMTMLVRIPMLSEIDCVVQYADISLNSDKQTLMALNDACIKHNRMHNVVLMADLGDLREGIWVEEDFIELALFVEQELSHIKLYGIGTNLGCYGAIKPTVEKMTSLASLAYAIEAKIGRELDIVSGGATSSVPLVVNDVMPSKVNHLRVGEGILLARDLTAPSFCYLDYMHVDTFVLKAQIIEIQEKPSHPVGEFYVDAFGGKPTFVDKGMRKRALLGIGRQDFGHHESLRTVHPGMDIVGSSSDHLIVDITDAGKEYEIGEIVPFTLFYQAMLFLTRSEDVHKIII